MQANVSLSQVGSNLYFGLWPSVKSVVLVHRSKFPSYVRTWHGGCQPPTPLALLLQAMCYSCVPSYCAAREAHVVQPRCAAPVTSRPTLRRHPQWATSVTCRSDRIFFPPSRLAVTILLRPTLGLAPGWCVLRGGPGYVSPSPQGVSRCSPSVCVCMPLRERWRHHGSTPCTGRSCRTIRSGGAGSVFAVRRLPSHRRQA